MKKTPSHFTARVEIEQQISFFSFGFARVSEVRHIFTVTGHHENKCQISFDYTQFTEIIHIYVLFQLIV